MTAQMELQTWIDDLARAATWQDRAKLRVSLTQEVLEQLQALDSEEVDKLLDNLFNHPYHNFEPRPDNHNLGDEQTGFLESKSLITVGVGGNGSGKTYIGAQRAVKFLCEDQPPPTRDTPFWIIANTFDQVCQSTWEQKLLNIMPRDWVDWGRITWYREKRNWPLAVPLKPWPSHPDRNWVLEFKSYEQGREQMQAAAIGGAWFTEQFPYDVFLEVLRGTREYAFPGSVWCEFTPIDPEKSVPMQEMYEKWIAGEPETKAWSFFHLNTKAAMEAGHVQSEWFDTFFGSISEEMRETRMAGAFASYEGAIYKSFRPRIHLVDTMAPPPGAIHKRSIDWGASEEHPFVCYDDQTEVLTENGWVRFEELNPACLPKVATVNANGTMEWQQPDSYIKQKYSGNMVLCEPEREGVNFCVTPNHDMLLKRKRTGKFIFRKAAEVHSWRDCNVTIPTAWEPADERDDSKERFAVPRVKKCTQLTTTKIALARLTGLLISEGSVCCARKNARVRVAQKDFCEEVREVMAATGWNWSESFNEQTGMREFTIYSRSLAVMLKEWGVAERSHQKRVPREIMGWGKKCLEALLEGLYLGDGRKNFVNKNGTTRNGSMTYYTSSPGLADDVQEIASRLGIASKIADQGKGSFSTSVHPMFAVRLLNSQGAVAGKLPTKLVPYDGFVYCVTVSNRTLVVRRGRQPMACGNCLWGYKDALGAWWIYDEYWSNSQSVTWDEHADEVKNRHPWPNDPHYRNTYGDPSRPDLIREFGRLGIPITSARNNVYEGIECVREHLKIDERMDQPRLFIHKGNCPHLARQMKTYRWERSSGMGTNPKAARPVPLKNDDDSADALRYLLFSDYIGIGLKATGSKIQKPVPKSIRFKRGAR